MLKQRAVGDLGINNSDVKSECYNWMRMNGKGVARCCRSTHEGERVLPIENFNLLNVSKSRKDGCIDYKLVTVQSYCIKCEREYRRNRIEKCKTKFYSMTPEEIRRNYISTYGIDTKKCSKCKNDVGIDNFLISKNMECGLHNMCKDCSKNYMGAVGDRFIVFSPDFNSSKNVEKKSVEVCCKCGSKSLKIHKDHIFPISKGGTDHIENIQMLCDKCNLSKSDTIHIQQVSDIKKNMICSRYHGIFDLGIDDIKKFEETICKMVSDFIQSKIMMSDIELHNFYVEYNKKNNLRKSPKRSVIKFRKYQER